ncbi:lipooligosaccharide transport system permease protein [Microbacterium terrae]|uniref:Transport permease protein n=1 Tax=Microbacterium terrae TaxID=69369 RepID=A0A0M2GZS8_9MICO|nr:ABC transporter permease [Microbacterium terrae]KJL39455.1 ABC-2 type transporter [Microbacterium terrae]MBP1078047.1 lipooligosaccharide transport system permease protein [Microbacterium terrae]GLK00216.1 transport permease protein [Microbacterium terrae]
MSAETPAVGEPPEPAATATRVQPSLDELRAEALEWGRKPRLWGTWYVTEHMVRAMRAYGWTIIVGALGQPILYLLGLAVGLAALIDAPIVEGGVEVSYLVFVAPALLMTAAISVASEEFSYPVIAGFKWRRYFFGFSASALSPGQIAGGVVAGAAARIVFVVAAYYGFLWIFGAVPLPATGWLMIPVGVLAGLAFGIPYMAYAASITEDKGQIALVQRFVFMPMFLFSGTFYPLATLPLWLQWIGWVSPLWHATELGRIASYDKPADPIMIVVHVGYLLLLSVGAYLVARRTFGRRLGE